MNDLNTLVLEGTVVENAIVEETITGSAICNFFVDVERTYKKGMEDVTEVSTFEVAAYGTLARALQPKLVKGTKVRAVGRLKQHRWTDKDGKKWSKIVVVAEHIEIKKGDKDGKSN